MLSYNGGNGISTVYNPYYGNSEIQSEEALYPRLEDISVNNITEKLPEVSGNTFVTKNTSRGIFTLSKYSDTNKYCLSFINTEYKKVWEYKLDKLILDIMLATDDFVVINDVDNLTAFDYKGNKLWSYNEHNELTLSDTFFSDNNGGIYAFGIDYSVESSPCMLIHISRKGKTLSYEPYNEAGNISPLSILKDPNNEYWLVGTQTPKNDKYFIAHLTADLSIDKKFELEEDQYPSVTFLPENNTIFLCGQAYTNDFKEYGFIYELDWDCNKKAYIPFEHVPVSICQMKNGNRAVGFSRYETLINQPVKIFDSDWNEIKSMELPYGFIDVYAAQDGGILVKGQRFSPGQTVYEINNDFAKFDTIFEKYDADGNLISRKTFFSEESNESRGYFSLVIDENIILL